jgi:membrane associated rhomboid family serine protease
MFKFLKSTLTQNKNPIQFTFTQFKNFHNKFNQKSNNFYKYNKKSFNNGSGFRFFDLMPPVTKAVVAANCVIYFIGMFMNEKTYIKEFFYNAYALQHNKFHVLITSFFAKANLFDFLLETVFTALLGSQLEMQIGSQAMKKLVLGSVGIGAVLLVLMHTDSTFFKSEAIFRALIMYFVFSNPQQVFTLFPFPIQVKALYLGIFVMGLDLISRRWANFGGALSAYALTAGLI